MTSKQVGSHIVRYGTPADQKYLLGPYVDSYDQLVMNAKMVAHAPAALATLISQSTNNKPYFIDPQTHAFQHDISYITSKSGELVRTIKSLIDSYGEPLIKKISKNKKPVIPSDFADSSIRRDFAANVINYQWNALAEFANNSDAAKYYRYLEKKKLINTPNFHPRILIAPYFYLSLDNFKKWLPVNLNFISESRKYIKTYHSLFGIQLVLSRDILLSDEMKNIIESYLSVASSEDIFMIWIDNFKEQASDIDELKAYTETLLSITKKCKCINLYGSYYSIALTKLNIIPGLIGVTHSLEYGEDRSVVPVGGGIPTAKFYIPKLYSRLQFRYALKAVKGLGGFKSLPEYHRIICSCRKCRQTITSNPENDFIAYGDTYNKKNGDDIIELPTAETKENCVAHYMWCKSKEYRSRIVLNEFKDELSDTAKSLKNILNTTQILHCNTWIDVLNEFE